MKFRSCAMRLNEDFDAWLFDDDTPEGTFCYRRQRWGDWRGTVLWVMMPYKSPVGATPVHCLRLHRTSAQKPPKPSWEWDGNKDSPTLMPSIRCGPKDCSHWHGYITAGRIEACE